MHGYTGLTHLASAIASLARREHSVQQPFLLVGVLLGARRRAVLLRGRLASTVQHAVVGGPARALGAVQVAAALAAAVRQAHAGAARGGFVALVTLAAVAAAVLEARAVAAAHRLVAACPAGAAPLSYRVRRVVSLSIGGSAVEWS